MKIIFRLTEPTIYTRQYETAAWWTKIEVPAGDYDAEPIHIGGQPATIDSAYYFVVRMPGIVVGEYMPSLYGGVPIPGSDRGKDRIGTDTVHSMAPYGYMVRDYAAGKPWGLPGEWLLVPTNDEVTS